MPFIFMGETTNDVIIKESKIRGAGMGLFANKSFRKGEFICWYTGVFVLKEHVEQQYYKSSYLYQYPNSPFIIDAEDPLSCYARYANDSLSLRKNNADFDKFVDVPSAHLVAIKAIRKNAEIYVSYGPEFWQDNHLEGLPQQDLDFIQNDMVRERDAELAND